MEVLTGHPLAWGTTFDINERAKRLRDDVQEKASAFPEGPNDLWRRIQEARLSGDSKELEKLLDEDGRIREFASEQVDAVRSPLLTELLRVLQHMDDARAQWEKAPVRAGNFQDYLGADRFPKVEAAMRELGITPKQGKGKNQVVAALHCACERFGLRLPPPGRWPGMLEATYPSTTWSEKCVPEERKSYRTKSYHRAYQAVLDRLK
jgi:hypothetical protein